MSDEPRLFRIILHVTDMEAASAFYARLLDSKGMRVHESRHYFKCGDVILALLDPKFEDDTARPNADNIYFATKDLEGVFARAKELDCLSKSDVHGVPAGELITRPWGERSFYAQDPWGNKLCFVDEKTLFTGR